MDAFQYSVQSSGSLASVGAAEMLHFPSIPFSFHLHLILPPRPPPFPIFPTLLLLVFSQKEDSFQQDQVPEQSGLLHYFRGTDAQRGRW